MELYVFNFLQDIPIDAPPPLHVIKIVKYCGIWGGGSAFTKILQKIMALHIALSISVIKKVQYCGVGGWGH